MTKAILNFVFTQLLPHAGRVKLVFTLLRWYQRIGLQKLLRLVMPEKLRDLDAMLPAIPAKFFQPAANFLPAVVEGKLKMAFAHTEKGARYNLAKVNAQAKKAGPGWEITGAKVVVLGAPAADTFVVSANTDKGLSLFLVKKESVKVNAYVTLDEQRAGDVSFSKSPGELLGTEGGVQTMVG